MEHDMFSVLGAQENIYDTPIKSIAADLFCNMHIYAAP